MNTELTVFKYGFYSVRLYNNKLSIQVISFSKLSAVYKISIWKINLLDNFKKQSQKQK